MPLKGEKAEWSKTHVVALWDRIQEQVE